MLPLEFKSLVPSASMRSRSFRDLPNDYEESEEKEFWKMKKKELIGILIMAVIAITLPINLRTHITRVDLTQHNIR
jgi:hypothetical protein